MRIIQCLSDIEYLRTLGYLPNLFIKEIEQDFLGIYEAENHDNIYLLNYRLPLVQALFVFENGDDVIGRFSDPFALEFVEKVEIDEVAYYRCGLRKGPFIQLYYSLVNSHNAKIEEWLREQAEWNKGIGDF
ncbi:hypothetical protein [Lysinibacillus endophyticus]|uniref:hypothetical protein n=1 Tax=Ureibacillus endophyticus TaxID=1978490 RepID=UPI0020A1178C|nr:hypothetical protein [Lysinibacillus endophyticus]MCP1143659.1 hypothetical protein [Lysinibacillus endophyticus]